MKGGFCGDPLGGRFWAIASSTGDEDGLSVVDSDESPELLSRSLSYLDRAPSPVRCDLSADSVKALDRREKKKKMQREMARILDEGMSPFSTHGCLSNAAGRPELREKKPESTLKLPALSPTTFLLDSFNAADWIAVTRRRRKEFAKIPGHEGHRRTGRRSAATVFSAVHLQKTVSPFSKCRSDNAGCVGRSSNSTSRDPLVEL
jgi:hypothetical protein